jgi:hypothetical protein
MKTQSAADRIVQRYRARSRTPFPTAEIARVVPHNAERSLFHGRLETFLSNIAGYASSAHRLKRRPVEELRAARELLSQSFFEKHTEYGPYRTKITQQETPALFVEMETVEQNRVDLLDEMERLLKSE